MERIDKVISSQTDMSRNDVKKYIKKGLFLDGLTSSEDLILPEYVGEGLNLNRLTSLKGLVLPKHITGLFVHSLESIEGLKLPNDFDINNLNSMEEITGEKWEPGERFVKEFIPTIKSHPAKYFRTKEEEEKLFSSKDDTIIQYVEEPALQQETIIPTELMIEPEKTK